MMPHTQHKTEIHFFHKFAVSESKLHITYKCHLQSINATQPVKWKLMLRWQFSAMQSLAFSAQLQLNADQISY